MQEWGIVRPFNEHLQLNHSLRFPNMMGWRLQSTHLRIYTYTQCVVGGWMAQVPDSRVELAMSSCDRTKKSAEAAGGREVNSNIFICFSCMCQPPAYLWFWKARKGLESPVVASARLSSALYIRSFGWPCRLWIYLCNHNILQCRPHRLMYGVLVVFLTFAIVYWPRTFPICSAHRFTHILVKWLKACIYN